MDFAYKVLKKLGLGHGAYKLMRPVYSSKYKAVTAAESSSEALAFLNSMHEEVHPPVYIPARPEAEDKDSVDLDIIIAAYNVEKYVAQCIQSVLNQKTRFTYRVIVVDDGSTDSTSSILESITGIELVHQANKGLSGARNTGLELAIAEYVMFLDSDDCLCPGAVEALLSAAVEHDAWLVEGNYTEVDLEGKVIRKHKHKAGELDPEKDCAGYAWGKLVKRELFNNLLFPAGYWYQDSIIYQVLMPLAKQSGHPVWGVEDSIVLYRQNPNGITKKSRKKAKSLDSLYLCLHLFEDRKAFGIDISQSYYDYILRMASQTYSRTKNLGDEVQQAVFIVYADFVEKNFHDYKTQNSKLACLEKAIHERDYGSYLAYCKLH